VFVKIDPPKKSQNSNRPEQTLGFFFLLLLLLEFACFQIMVMIVVKEGWLWKRSQHLKQWRRRWVKVTPNSLLCFSPDHAEKLHCTAVLLFPQGKPKVEDDTHNTEFFAFVVINGFQRLYFGAENSSEREQWKHAIVTAPEKANHAFMNHTESETSHANPYAAISDMDSFPALLHILPDLLKTIKKNKLPTLSPDELWAPWRGTDVDVLCKKARGFRKDATFEFVRSEKEELYNASVAAYDEALIIDPTCAPALYGRGVALRRLGRHMDAVDSFLQSLTYNALHGHCWHNLASSLVMIGRWDEAIQCFYAAVRLDGPNRMYATDHALAIEHKGDMVEFERRREYSQRSGADSVSA
jgi:tetratricopeptide (TPR) repeat protein